MHAWYLTKCAQSSFQGKERLRGISLLKWFRNLGQHKYGCVCWHLLFSTPLGRPHPLAGIFSQALLSCQEVRSSCGITLNHSSVALKYTGWMAYLRVLKATLMVQPGVLQGMLVRVLQRNKTHGKCMHTLTCKHMYVKRFVIRNWLMWLGM